MNSCRGFGHGTWSERPAAIDRNGTRLYIAVRRLSGDHPATPVWCAPAIGLWSAVMVDAIGGLDAHPMIFVPALLVLAVSEGMLIGWYRRYRGTLPSVHRVPKEISTAMRDYFIGSMVVLGVVVGVSALWGALAASITAFVVVTAALIWYERRYAKAAQEAKNRIARVRS